MAYFNPANAYSGYSGYGAQGFQGAQGAIGSTGAQGFQGPQGVSGYSGFTGISGYSGFTGISGYSGFSGVKGSTGLSGTSGYSGFTGISGYSGFSGPQGFQGPQGFSGTSGYSGFTGISGFSGPGANQTLNTNSTVVFQTLSAFSISAVNLITLNEYFASASNFTTYGNTLLSGATTVQGNMTVNGVVSASQGTFSSGGYVGSYSDGIIVDYATGNGRISVGPADNITFYNGGPATTALVTILASGNLGVGTTSPSSTLTVNGTLSAAGAVAVSNNTFTIDKTGNVVALSYSSTSTRLQKTNIRDLEDVIPDALGVTQNLHPVVYDSLVDASSKDNIGLVAEDVYPLLPNVVNQYTDANGDQTFVGIDYSRLTAILIDNIKVLSNKIQELSAKLPQ
jgi:hypothetical protein